MEIWLQLTEEFGGSWFGPIDGAEFRLGTGDDNHVRINEGLGVAPQHVRLVRRGEGSFLLAPVERSAAVWLYRSGQVRPTAVQSPTVVNIGDSFSLVTPDGVRFRIAQRESRRRKKDAAGGGGPNRRAETVERYKAGLLSEVARRIRAAALSTWLGRMIQNGWFFVRTGQMFSPVYIIGFLMMMSGFSGTAFMKCSRDDYKAKLAESQAETQQCNANQAALSAADGGSRGLPELTARILQDNSWAGSLEWPAMKSAMTDEIKLLLEGDRLVVSNWRDGWKQRFEASAKALQGQGLPAEVAQALAWTTIPLREVPPRRADPSAHDIVGVSDAAVPDHRACQRGAFRLTWRQAYRLNLDTAEDMVVSVKDQEMLRAGLSLGGTNQQVEQTLVSGFSATRRSAGAEVPDGRSWLPFTNETIAQTETAAGQSVCIVRINTDPADARTSIPKSATALARHLGVGVAGLPAKQTTNWISGRVATFYALDAFGDIQAPRIDTQPLSASFAAIEQSQAPVAQTIAQQTGRALARAVVLPCLLRTERTTTDEPVAEGLKAPSIDDCASLIARARLNKL